MNISRRSFMKAGLSSFGWYAAQSAVPTWLAQSAHALSPSCFESDKILVIFQQNGGNDGLNTVIPRSDNAYYAARPKLAIPKGQEINLDGLNGLHPKLVRLANWYQRGNMAIVQNVGYTNPNLSHFESMDYCDYAITPGMPTPDAGWLARYFEHNCSSGAASWLTNVAAGMSNVPLPLSGGSTYVAPAIGNPQLYSFQGYHDKAERLEALEKINTINSTDPELEFLRRSYNVASATASDIVQATTQPDLVAASAWPDEPMGRSLKLVSQIIRAGFPTKVFFVSQGGYDTHAGQVDPANTIKFGAHPKLMDSFDRGIDSFLTEMELSGNLDRVVLMTYSEFGRRVGENGSHGTDHGAANCAFAFGGGVEGGIYGGQPNLTDLVAGSLKHQVDFRAVYARCMEGLFGVSTENVFGKSSFDEVIQMDLPKIPFLDGLPAPVNTGVSGWMSY